ncbi:alpha/beta hydrolase family protein [Furfurilactobacillus curtus]|uniref:Peptidase S9 n=1 Tax=Furfurilactobacillus curtus TaxID=1746200 RepID=A0ABQ5JPP2_9LACO
MAKPVAVTDLFELVAMGQPVANDTGVFYLTTKMRQRENDYVTMINRFGFRTQTTTMWGTGNGSDNQLQLADTVLLFTSEDEHQKRQVFTQSLAGGSPVQRTFESFGVAAFVFDTTRQVIYYQTALKRNGIVPAKADPRFPKPISYTKTVYKDNDLGYFAEDERYVIKRQVVGQITASEIWTSEDRFTLGPLSHDGRQLTVAIAGRPEVDWDFSQVTRILDVETGEQRTVKSPSSFGTLAPVAFNPSDTVLLLTGSTNEIPNISAQHLYAYAIDQQQLTELTPNPDVVVGDLVMNTDAQQNLHGRAAMFIDDQQYVYQQLITGQLQLVLGQLGDDPDNRVVVAGGPRHVTDFTTGIKQHRLYFMQSQWTQVAKLVALDLDTQTETTLINPNAAYEEKHDLVKPQVVNFTTADGFHVRGWYLPPVDAPAMAKYPAILYIHGGPGANYGETFFHELQVYASYGYGVIAINPRGSTSYGEAFQRGVIGHYGQGDYEDLMAAVDRVLASDVKIDREHLYVTGGSYGGFMTNWIEGHTDRFKAAVTQRSIANWISMFGTSDIGYYFLPWELTGQRQMAVTDLKPLWDASPLKYVDRVHTPTLILHSEQDFRCPIGQGEEWFTSLKLNGIEAKMVRFPGENHDLSRIGKPSLRVARIQAIRDWFDTHQ